MSDMKKLFERRLARYQAAIALEPADRIPLATGSNYFAEVYSGNKKQETLYDMEKWLAAEIRFCQDFPQIDVLRNSRIYGPLYDALGSRHYKLPGRDLPADTQFQFVEREYMLADEYDEFLKNPTAFIVTKVCPRLFSEMGGADPVRYANALVKAGLAQAAHGAHMRRRTQVLAEERGMPQPMGGAFLAPLDALSDALRDMKGIMKDMRRQPEKVLAACEALVPEMINIALATGDPLKRWPIFCPTHKGMFLSPKEYDRFYWPSFKKVLEGLIAAGYKARVYLEGDQNVHIRHFQELPKGSLLLDIDNGVDILKAKELLGGWQCLAGGLEDSQLILGKPEAVRERVKFLCQTIGREPGFILSGGCNFPYDAKAENFKAVCEAVEEFGWLDRNLALAPKAAPAGVRPEPRRLTSWENRKSEWGGVIPGDEEIVKNAWNLLENQSYVFWWSWCF